MLRCFNTIDDPYAQIYPNFQICVPDKVKIMNVEVFNLMPKVNETRLLVQHESSDCKFRLNKSVYNSRKKLNQDKC